MTKEMLQMIEDVRNGKMWWMDIIEWCSARSIDYIETEKGFYMNDEYVSWAYLNNEAAQINGEE